MHDGSSAPAARWLPIALRYPLFARLWAGTLVSNVGTQMNNVAKLWVLYQLTHSASALGVETMCFSVPIAVLPLMAGPVADRVNRATLLKSAVAAEAIEAGALAVVAGTGGLRAWVIYLAALADAARQSFDIPARAALTPALVPGDALLSAQSLSGMVWPSSALAGPALGGLMVAGTGPAAVFALNSLSSLAALAAIVPVTDATDRASTADRTARPRLTEGMRRIGQDRRLLALQVVSLGISTLMLGTEILLPVLDTAAWHGGSQGYGLLRMAPGIAAIASGLGLATLRQVRHPSRAVSVSILGGCAALIAFTVTPVFAVGFVLLGLAAFGLSTVQILVTTRIQVITPEGLRGAIGGISAISQSGLAGIGAAGMALTAASVGTRTAIIAVTAIVAVIGLVCPARAYRKL